MGIDVVRMVLPLLVLGSLSSVVKELELVIFPVLLAPLEDVDNGIFDRDVQVELQGVA